MLLAAMVAAAAWGGAARSEGEQKVLQEAAAMRAAGRLAEALDALRQESRRLKSIEGEDSKNLLPINDLAAEILIDQGAVDTARGLLDKTIASRRKLVEVGWGDLANDLGNSLLILSRLETEAKRLPAAAEAARQALVLRGRVSEPGDQGVARAEAALLTALDAIEAAYGAAADVTRQARNEASAAFTSLGLFTPAIEQRRKNLESLLLGQTRDAGDVVDAAVRFGRLMREVGFAAESLEPVEKSLKAIQQSHADEALAIRRLLGELQFSAEKLSVAAVTFGEVHEALRAGSKPSDVVKAGDQLWRLLVEVSRGNEVSLPDWFEAAVKQLSRPPQAEVGNAIQALMVAADVQNAVAKPSAGLETLRRGLALASGLKPPDGGAVAELLGLVAGAQIEIGEVSAARKALEQAIPAAEQDLGPGDPRVSLMRIRLADALQRERLDDKAAALATKAIERGLPRPNDAWEDQAVAVYDRIAAAPDHESLRERYIARRIEQYGANHRHVSAVCRSFGGARLAAGDWQAATAYFQRALDIQRSNSDDDDPDVAAVMVMLANAERLAGKSRDAVRRAAAGLEAWERAAGPNHPGTMSAVEVLVEAKVQSGDDDGLSVLLERLCGARAVASPVRRAGHLVRLAALKVTGDKVRARELLATAMELPCWQSDAEVAVADRLRLALSAAIAAHAFGQAGDSAKATEAVQLARRLALQAENPKPLIDRIEQLAARGEQPTDGP